MAKNGAGAPSLATVDVVLLTPGEHDLLVYLRKRNRDPQRGRLSLPSLPYDGTEPTEETAARVLRDLTNLPQMYLRQLYTFSRSAASQGVPPLSITYYALFPTDHQRANAEPLEDAWVPLRRAIDTPLAFDHARVLQTSLERLQGRLNYTLDACYLLPERFSIPQLQHVHEVILGETIKPDVFTKRVREPLKNFRTRETAPTNGAGRPARLYRNPVAISGSNTKTEIINA